MFLDRNFNLWRWDELSITEQLYDVSPLILDDKVRNCSKRRVQYVESNGNEIETVIKLLSSHKNEAKSAAGQTPKLYGDLFALAFSALRETVPFSEMQIHQAQKTIDACGSVLNSEGIYLSTQMQADCAAAIALLAKIYSKDFKMTKNSTLMHFLTNVFPKLWNGLLFS